MVESLHRVTFAVNHCRDAALTKRSRWRSLRESQIRDEIGWVEPQRYGNVGELNDVEPPLAKFEAGDELFVKPKASRKFLLGHAESPTFVRELVDKCPIARIPKSWRCYSTGDHWPKVSANFPRSQKL